MESIKILIPTHVTPDTKSVVTLFFENLLPILEQYVHVHVFMQYIVIVIAMIHVKP